MIYIVRHGQTIWNCKKRKQGRKDSPLTIEGFNQSKHISNVLSKNIDNFNDFNIIISPLFRVKQFTSLICEHLCIDFESCVVDDRLQEHSFGLWEGLTDEEIESEFPGMGEERYNNWWNYVVPMGESYELLRKRITPFLNEIENKNVIIITHEMVSKVIRGVITKMDETDILNLGHKQDSIYRISEGKIDELR